MVDAESTELAGLDDGQLGTNVYMPQKLFWVSHYQNIISTPGVNIAIIK